MECVLSLSARGVPSPPPSRLLCAMRCASATPRAIAPRPRAAAPPCRRAALRPAESGRRGGGARARRAAPRAEVRSCGAPLVILSRRVWAGGDLWGRRAEWARGVRLLRRPLAGAPLVILSGSRGSCGPWQRLVHASKGFECDPQHRESVTMPREGGPRGCATLKGWARSAKAPRPKKSWSRARGRCANLSRREGSADACFSSAPPPLPSPLQNKVVVAGDVGGTNARWQLYSGDTLLFDRRYPTASHTTLEKSLGAFLEEAATAGHDGRPEAACVAAAGPVAQDRCEMTNLGWTVRSARTCSCDLVSTP